MTIRSYTLKRLMMAESCRRVQYTTNKTCVVQFFRIKYRLRYSLQNNRILAILRWKRKISFHQHLQTGSEAQLVSNKIGIGDRSPVRQSEQAVKLIADPPIRAECYKFDV
jgi:hypothetical protein